jgi:hypothetical protein
VGPDGRLDESFSVAWLKDLFGNSIERVYSNAQPEGSFTMRSNEENSWEIQCCSFASSIDTHPNELKITKRQCCSVTSSIGTGPNAH